MKKISLQNRIAINIIVSTAILTVVLCAVILIVFRIHIEQIDEDNISLENVKHLFMILLKVCVVGCFVTFSFLYIISRKIAQKSTKPIRDIINISNNITHNNLSSRIPLPYHKDELYELSETINNLLDRIENAIEREKSFTSYASHEFRTPLAVLKGTMEVLIRRPRSEEEYKLRIGACIKEVDKLNNMVEQLLILTRFEEENRSFNYSEVSIDSLVSSSLSIYSDTVIERNIECKISILPENAVIYTDEYFFSTILKNLISNAVKYVNDGGTIEVTGYQEEDVYTLKIINSGSGISEQELNQIFEKFYRSYSSGQSNVKGFGLGLPIVKRICHLLNIEIHITSQMNGLTIARLTIPPSAKKLS